jgi:hypothetical protein
MPNRAESAKLDWPRWQQVLLIALLAMIIGNKMTMLVDAAAHRAGLTGELAYWGGSLVPDPEAEAGFVEVVDVVPGSPFAKAGVREGDHVRTVPSYARLRRYLAGEKLNFTLDQDGVKSNRRIAVEPVPDLGLVRDYNSSRLLNALAVMVSMLISCFILWRGWGNKTAMLLGAALASQGIGALAGVPPWASTPLLAIPMWSLVMAGSMLVFLLIPFAMRMFEASVGPLPRWHWHLASAFLVLVVLGYALATWDMLFLTHNLAWMGGANNLVGLVQIGFLASIAYLIAGWRRSAAATRNRLALIVFALTAYWLAALVAAWGLVQTGSFFSYRESNWLIYLSTLMQGVVAPGLLAYAVLRHKLFDLGFAINRTLVFGAIGGLLLVSFALIEWAIKQAIPKVWYGGSVYISAGLAVGLYLAFNRIHHKVEAVIERLFFHRWQLNEAALKRFVAAAAHVEKPEALAGNFVAELVRFSGGATASLYARTPEGHYADAGGATVDADDPALAALRAEQGAVVPAELGSPLEAALALPMMHQAALAGFVLLGPKPTGEDYRPDEIDNLAWATQQVGLDLQAIRVRELELSVTTLEARNRNLSEILTNAAVAGA